MIIIPILVIEMQHVLEHHYTGLLLLQLPPADTLRWGGNVAGMWSSQYMVHPKLPLLKHTSNIRAGAGILFIHLQRIPFDFNLPLVREMNQ